MQRLTVQDNVLQCSSELQRVVPSFSVQYRDLVFSADLLRVQSFGVQFRDAQCRDLGVFSAAL